jgi:hypothetical protein
MRTRISQAFWLFDRHESTGSVDSQTEPILESPGAIPRKRDLASSKNHPDTKLPRPLAGFGLQAMSNSLQHTPLWRGQTVQEYGR